MGLARTAGNTKDTNQDDIVKALRKVGFSVVVMDEPTDLAVGRAGLTYFLEVKKDEKAKLTPKQVNFHLTWKGHKAIVWNERMAIEACTPPSGIIGSNCR
jgi:hypothetical protein